MAKNFLIAGLVVAGAATPPAYLNDHRTHAADTKAIEHLLTTYTTAVTHGDQEAFESLLLNEDVTFASTNELVAPQADTQSFTTRRYSRFRKSVFASGAQFSQEFFNVHIQQDGDLAQVSLDFVTKRGKDGDGGYGWKTLQLLKVQGQWKIVSELYTVRTLPRIARW